MTVKVAGTAMKMAYRGTKCGTVIRRSGGALADIITATRKKIAVAIPAPVASSVVMSGATTNISPYSARPMIARAIMLFFIVCSLF